MLIIFFVQDVDGWMGMVDSIFLENKDKWLEFMM